MRPEFVCLKEAPAIDPMVLWQMYQNFNQKQMSTFYFIQDWRLVHPWPQSGTVFFMLMVVLGQAGPTYLSVSMPTHQKY